MAVLQRTRAGALSALAGIAAVVALSAPAPQPASSARSGQRRTVFPVLSYHWVHTRRTARPGSMDISTI